MRDFISQLVRQWVLPYTKAWVAAAVAFLAGWLSNWGLDLPEETTLALVTGLTAFFTWLLPNVPYVKKK